MSALVREFQESLGVYHFDVQERKSWQEAILRLEVHQVFEQPWGL